MTRLAVIGREELVSAIVALGYEPGDDGPVVVLDSEDADALARASTIPSEVPRIVIAPPEKHSLLQALGMDASRIVTSASAALLGPAITAVLPVHPRPATRVVAVTGTRGGVGRTLLVTNLGRRLARSSRVAIIDATGSGAAAWWLAADAASWSELEPLATELSAEHLSIVAREAAPGLHLVGGRGMAPSVSIVAATVRAALAAFDLVVVDAAPAFCEAFAALRPLLDRALVATYDDPVSVAGLRAPSIAEADWILASQFAERRVGGRDVFRVLPRDERAVAAAFASRGAVGGRLGHVYDELAEVVAIDATR